MNKILKNLIWLIFDKILILILQFFIGVKIANYYGSEIYGSYNYIITLISFSAIFFELINSRVVKKYYTEDNYDNIVFNVTFFRNSIAIVLFGFALLLKIVINIENTTYLVLLFLALDNILMTATMGIENFYEYKLESEKIVISNNIVKIISYVLQYIGVLLAYPIVMIPIVRCIGSFLRMLILKYLYSKDYKKNIRVKLEKELIKSMIKDSFYLWASFISFLLYTQLDKIMLGIMLGKSEVGIYSIGTQLSNIFAIMIVPIQTSLFPKMIKLYRENYNLYLNFYQKTNFLITQIYIIMGFLSIIILKLSFSYIFTMQYNGAINVYVILTIAVLMKANGALQTGHMTLKEITKKSFYKTLLGAFINIVLNYIFIKKFGIIGAAMATSITQIVVLLIVDFFIEEYKEQAFIQLKSFNSFYLIKMIKENNICKSMK